ncbi:hypothetical protein JCM10449v2_007180 [Rhodotorula kratochvilovae]
MEDIKPSVESNALTNGSTAKAASANIPSDEVVVHYTDVFASLLSSLSALLPLNTSVDPPASSPLQDATSWGELRTALRNAYGSPGAAFSAPGPLARDRAVELVQAARRIGAGRLGRDVAGVEKRALLASDEHGAREVWYGAVEAFTWLRAVRSALLWAEPAGDAPAPTTTPRVLQPVPVVPKREAQTPVVPSPIPLTDSASPAPAAPSSTFGFAPPPAPGALAKKLEAKKKARLSTASASPSVPAASPVTAPTPTLLAAPAPAPAAAAPAPADPVAEVPAQSTIHSVTPARSSALAAAQPPAPMPVPAPPAPPQQTPASKAAASAARMSGFESAQPVASTSSASPLDPTPAPPPPAPTAPLATPAPSAPLPAGAPSMGFAPPPAPGTAFEKPPKARKPRASSSKPAAAPRRTSDGILKGKGVGEVYVPPAPAARGEGAAERPARKRKVPLKLMFEQGEEGEEDWDEEDGEYGAKPAAGAKGRRGKRRSSVAPAGDGARAKKGRFSGFDDDEEEAGGADGAEDEEVDELASDYEEQMEKKAKAARERQLSRERSEELNKNRFAVGSCVMVKFPNYSWFPAIILDPKSAPSETQGKRVKGAYLVKSIPSGADHRWVAPDDGSIVAIQPTQLDDILLGRYKSPPPQSWVKWRSELVEAVMLIKSPERLADWLSRPTDLELAEAAKAEKKRAARAASYW